MTPLDRLTSDIHVHLDRQENTGWYSIHCPACGETRTRTGGFLFSDDSVTYNCFRGKCDASCSFKAGEYVSKKFKALMKAMGISIPVELLVAKKKSSLQALIEDESHLYKKHGYKTIQLPEEFVPFDACRRQSYKDSIAAYFEKRCVSLQDVFIAEDGRYKGLAAIGMYMHEKLIGAHIVTDKGYISHFEGNSHVLYIPEHTLSDPVIVVEGGMDAKCFPNTVATLSNKITPEQAFFLRGRNVIMLPDRKGGNRFIEQFSQYGWSMCIPPWEEKDLNAAVVKYGILTVAKMIQENTTKHLLEATARYKLWTLDSRRPNEQRGFGQKT